MLGAALSLSWLGQAGNPPSECINCLQPFYSFHTFCSNLLTSVHIPQHLHKKMCVKIMQWLSRPRCDESGCELFSRESGSGEKAPPGRLEIAQELTSLFSLSLDEKASLKAANTYIFVFGCGLWGRYRLSALRHKHTQKERNFVLTVKHGYFWAHSLSVGGKEFRIRWGGVC